MNIQLSKQSSLLLLRLFLSSMHMHISMLSVSPDIVLSKITNLLNKAQGIFLWYAVDMWDFVAERYAIELVCIG